MKPKWEDAPEWAGWLAMDEDREWRWHEDEPRAKSIGEWLSGARISDPIEWEFWLNTKERRP